MVAAELPLMKSEQAVARGPGRFGALLALGLVHCAFAGEERTRTLPSLTLQVAEHAALGGEIGLNLGLSCPPADTRCMPSVVSDSTFEQVTVDDPTVFEIAYEANASRVNLRAKREGVAKVQITVTAHDAEHHAYRDTFTRTLDVRATDRVELDYRGTCDTPLLFGTGTSFEIKAKLSGRGAPLTGDPVPFPASSDVAKLERAFIGILSFKAQQTAGAGKVQSTLDPMDAIDVEVFDRSQVTALAVSVQTSARLGELPLVSSNASFTLRPELTVGTRKPCDELFPIKVTTDTPTVCTPPQTRRSSGIAIKTGEPGLCTLRIELGSLRVTQSVEVRRNG